MKKLLVILFLSIFCAPYLVQAADLQIAQTKAITDLFIDSVTLSRGYTLTTPAQQFFLGVWPEVLAVETRVVVKQYDNSLFTFPDGFSPVSDVYEFDIFNKDAFQNHKPLLIRFALENEVRNYKRVYFYNGVINQWVELPSYSDGVFSVKAPIHLPYAKLVVLKDTEHLEYGDASWYEYRDCDCAASPDFPKGSYVRVKNLDNGQSVIVKINDYGPDRSIFPRRIIDLDQVAFAKLGNLRQGILKNIKVEPL